MSEIEQLKFMVDSLNKMTELLQKQIDQIGQRELDKDSQLDALKSVIEELSIKQGISKERIKAELNARYFYFRQKQLEAWEDLNPEIAATLGATSLGASSAAAELTPLFPPIA